MRLVLLAFLFAISGCHHRAGNHVTGGVLGRVVIYRNGVAFYERHARLDHGKVVVRVPRERVDDFLKSLTVVERATGKPLGVTIPRTQDGGAHLTMVLEAPGARDGDVLLTYVTAAPAWKPSYRIVLGADGKLMLEAWAVVDNTTSEDWNGVLVGVGASSALAFRYDLWSVRTVDRDLLADEQRLAIAPPQGVSPYASGGDAEELVAIDGRSLGVSFSGSTSTENQFVLDGVMTGAGRIEGVVTDGGHREKLAGVTVVATDAAGHNATAISDEAGRYALAVAPGTYTLTYYYADATLRRDRVAVAANARVAVDQAMPASATAGGETISVSARAPTIDPTSTTQGITIDRQVLHRVPVPGRTFGAVLGSAAGSQHDGPSAAPPPAPPIADAQLKAIVAKVNGQHREVVVEVHGPPGSDAQATARGTAIAHRLVDAGIAADKIHVVPRLGAGEPETVRVLAVAPHARAAEAASRAAQIDRSDTPVGESHFLADRPMTVRAGSSAMVAMVRGETTGGVVYLYDPVSERGDDRFAFKAVRLDNPTDDTLEPGPVTVYGDGRFVGEGITEPVPPHATAVIPFALDKQIVVERDGDEADRIAKLVTIERGVITAEVQHRRVNRFAITSRLDAPMTVYLRHRLESGWTLGDHPPAQLRVGDSYLFPVEVAPRATAHVTIAEATPVERTFDLSSDDALGMMKVYVTDPDGAPELARAVDALLASHRAAADLVDRIETLRDQLAEYRSRAGELHAQIVTLKRVRGGGDLLAALRAKLTEISDRTQRATLALVDAQEQLMLARVKFQNQLAELRLPE